MPAIFRILDRFSSIAIGQFEHYECEKEQMLQYHSKAYRVNDGSDQVLNA